MDLNYDRYASVDYRKMNRRGPSYWIYRHGPDKIVLPLINSLKGKAVLEVGLGAGYYTGYFRQNGCAVIGVDANPHLGAHLGVDIVKATADDFSRFFIHKSFDVVASFWMTEYLDSRELKGFIEESFAVLKSGGIFITTIPQNKGLGKLHVFASSLKHIQKYHYTPPQFLPWFGSANVTVQSLNGIMGLPYSHLVCAKKP